VEERHFLRGGGGDLVGDVQETIDRKVRLGLFYNLRRIPPDLDGFIV
jgi:hypothetical protein